MFVWRSSTCYNWRACYCANVCMLNDNNRLSSQFHEPSAGITCVPLMTLTCSKNRFRPLNEYMEAWTLGRLAWPSQPSNLESRVITYPKAMVKFWVFWEHEWWGWEQEGFVNNEVLQWRTPYAEEAHNQLTWPKDQNRSMEILFLGLRHKNQVKGLLCQLPSWMGHAFSWKGKSSPSHSSSKMRIGKSIELLVLGENQAYKTGSLFSGGKLERGWNWNRKSPSSFQWRGISNSLLPQ